MNSLAQLLVHKMLTDQVIRPLGPTPEQTEGHQYYDAFNAHVSITSATTYMKGCSTAVSNIPQTWDPLELSMLITY